MSLAQIRYCATKLKAAQCSVWGEPRVYHLCSTRTNLESLVSSEATNQLPVVRLCLLVVFRFCTAADASLSCVSFEGVFQLTDLKARKGEREKQKVAIQRLYCNNRTCSRCMLRMQLQRLTHHRWQPHLCMHHLFIFLIHVSPGTFRARNAEQQMT